MKSCIFKIAVLLVLLLISFFNNYCFASKEDLSVDNVIKQGDSFIKSAEKNKDNIKTLDGKDFGKDVRKIMGTFYIIGVAIATIWIALLGIKILTGTAEDKAEVEERMVPYIIGAAVIYGAYPIWKIAMIFAGWFN